MAGRETPELAAAAVAGGADLVELGFPFSDPLAAGPVIRRAAQPALARGMRARASLERLARRRVLLPDTPLVPMPHAPTLHAYRRERSSAAAQARAAAHARPPLRRLRDLYAGARAHRGRARGRRGRRLAGGRGGRRRPARPRALRPVAAGGRRPELTPVVQRVWEMAGPAAPGPCAREAGPKGHVWGLTPDGGARG